MQLATSTPPITPLMPPRTPPEQALTAFSTSIGKPKLTLQNIRGTLRSVGLAAKEALDEGFRAFNLGDMRSAAVAFERLVHLLPVSGSYALWGYTFFYREDYLRAANLFGKAVKLDPRDAHAQASLGLAYSRLNKPRRAIQAFRKTLEVNPADAGVHFYLGYLYSSINQWLEAEREYRAAIQFNKNFLEAYQYLSDLHLDLGRSRETERAERFQQAIDAYQELIDSIDRSEPNWSINVAAAYNNVGVIYYEMGNHAEALKAFEKAVEHGQEDVIGLANLGSAYMDAARPEDARPIWRRLAETPGEQLEDKNLFLAQVYNLLGVTTLDVASRGNGTGEGSGRQELLREAEDAFKQSISFDPQSADPYVGLGVTYSTINQVGEARDAFVRALELDPHNTAALNNLDEIPLNTMGAEVIDGQKLRAEVRRIADKFGGAFAEIKRRGD